MPSSLGMTSTYRLRTVAAVTANGKAGDIEPHCPLGVRHLNWQRGEEACATSEMIS
jgi:hypothetical protein